MTIERTANEIIVRLPADMNPDGLQNILNYLTYQEATRHSQATQAQVDALAEEVKKDWWKHNRRRFLK